MQDLLNCYNCYTDLNNEIDFCILCQKVQPLSVKKNYFHLFNIDENIQVDLQKLEQIYLNKNLRLHPDLYYNASKQEKLYAMQMTAHVNDAYTVLSNTQKRIQHILAIHNNDQSETQTFTDDNFLPKIIDWQEQLANDSNDIKVIKSLNTDITVESKSILAQIEQDFIIKDWAKLQEKFCKLQYCLTLDDRIKCKLQEFKV